MVASKQRESLSVGQLAARWGVGVDRIRRMIEAGQLPGTFRLPSAGRYGQAVRIPIDVVLKLEESWTAVQVPAKKKPPRRQGGSLAALKHFPELIPPDCDAGCREDVPH